jgi:hypothetical protein
MNEMPHTMSGMVIRTGWYLLRNMPEVFRREAPMVSYDMLFKDPHDGCTRHDDVWGG